MVSVLCSVQVAFELTLPLFVSIAHPFHVLLGRGSDRLVRLRRLLIALAKLWRRRCRSFEELPGFSALIAAFLPGGADRGFLHPVPDQEIGTTDFKLVTESLQGIVSALVDSLSGALLFFTLLALKLKCLALLSTPEGFGTSSTGCEQTEGIFDSVTSSAVLQESTPIDALEHVGGTASQCSLAVRERGSFGFLLVEKLAPRVPEDLSGPLPSKGLFALRILHEFGLLVAVFFFELTPFGLVPFFLLERLSANVEVLLALCFTDPVGARLVVIDGLKLVDVARLLFCATGELSTGSCSVVQRPLLTEDLATLFLVGFRPLGQGQLLLAGREEPAVGGGDTVDQKMQVRLGLVVVVDEEDLVIVGF